MPLRRDSNIGDPVVFIEATQREWAQVVAVVSIGFFGVCSAIKISADFNGQHSFSFAVWALTSLNPHSNLPSGLVVLLSVFVAFGVGALLKIIAPIHVTAKQAKAMANIDTPPLTIMETL